MRRPAGQDRRRRLQHADRRPRTSSRPTNCNALPFSPGVQRPHQAAQHGSPQPGRDVDDDLADDRRGRAEEGRRHPPGGGQRQQPGTCGQVLGRRLRRRHLPANTIVGIRRGRLSAPGRAADRERLPARPVDQPVARPRDRSQGRPRAEGEGRALARRRPRRLADRRHLRRAARTSR